MLLVDEILVPPYKPDDLDDIPEISKQLHDMPAMHKTEWLIKETQWKSMLQAYLACMAFMDHQLGKVLDALENSEYLDNTIIVLWSDHGYHLGEKNRTCKHSLWQRSTHVPLIFAGNGIKAKSTCDAELGWVHHFIKFPTGDPRIIKGNGAEFIAVDKHGNIYGGEVVTQKLIKYIRVRP